MTLVARGSVAPARRVPEQKPGRSRQDFGTDPLFIAAVLARFGPLHVDLAATAGNAQAPLWVSPERDSLKVPWSVEFRRRTCWLNPPFGHIKPWAEKCEQEARAAAMRGDHRFAVLLLTPMGVQDWAVEHAWGKYPVLGLHGRLRFVGEEDAYPKDCMLTVFGGAGRGVGAGGPWWFGSVAEARPDFSVWSWRDHESTPLYDGEPA